MNELLQHIENKFKGIEFNEEKHLYSVNGSPLNTSVSGRIKQYYTPFNAQEAAENKSKRTGVSAEDYLKEWKEINLEAITRGNRVHIFGENYPYNKSLVPSCPQEEAVVKFWNSLPEHIILVGVEIRMYHFSLLYPGTMDILLFDTKNQTYIIADYKTNKDLFKNFQGQTMLGPFEYKLDRPFSHYEIQLSYYQILIEQILGITVSRRIVVYLGLDGEYKMYDCEDVRHLLN